MLRQCRARPFRAGFAIAAGSYFVFFTLFPENSWQDNFPTSQAIGFCYAKLFSSAQTNPVSSWNYGGFGGFGGGFGGGGFGGGGAFFVADDNDSTKDAGDSDPNVNAFGVRANSSYNPNPNAAAALALQKQQDEIVAAHNFWIIGHSIWALIFGWVGGGWARFLARRQRKDDESVVRVSCVEPR